MLSIKHKDLAGRIASFETNHGKVETPILLPVISPLKQIIPIKEMQKIGMKACITNSYFLREEHYEKALKGVHKFLGFNGPVMTDSGAFQLMQFGKVNVTNEEIIAFEDAMGVDIGVPLDIPGLFDHSTTSKNIDITFDRFKKTREFKDRIWAAPLQGGTFLDLRKKASEKMSSLNPDYYAIGTVVPLMNDYRFAENIDILATCKQNIPLDKPVHHFGAGHPMFFAMAVAMGADVFDSAAYALFAKRGDYLTVSGTKRVSELEYLPCSCPICSSHSPKEMDEDLLAKHNLYVSFQEIDTIKQAILENTLWDLVDARSRTHPKLYEAFLRMKKYLPYLESLDPFTKKSFFYVSPESKNRVEVFRHKKKKTSGFDLFPFKNVPPGLSDMYPFGQRVLPMENDSLPHVSNIEKVNAVAEYQFGIKNLFPKTSRIQIARTGRIRGVYDKDVLLGFFRAEDFVLIPHAITKKIHSETKSWRVVVDNEVSEFARSKKNVFCKFVKKVDSKIRAGMEVLVVDEQDNLLASGTALLSAKEIKDFNSGVAVNVRQGF